MPAVKSIYETKASFYDSIEKKWIYGKFILKQHQVEFMPNNKNESIKFLLNTLSGIEKRQSSFMFPALVLVIKEEKYWFASFSNRDTVYNLVELFWRESLFSKLDTINSSPMKPANSLLGKELLGILQESESSLIEAANTLKRQGQQLEESKIVMEDVNSDLNAAEKFVNNMSASQALLNATQSSCYQNEKSDSEKTELISENRQKHFKISYALQEVPIDSSYWEKGTLIVEDQIIIQNDSQVEQVRVSYDELKSIKITSPWEFHLNCISDSKVKKFFVLCPSLAGLLKFLNSIPILKRKILFEDDEDTFLNTQLHSNSPTNDPNTSCASISHSHTTDVLQLQSQEEETVSEISDEDIAELSNMLSNLQSLAIEVGREQREQLEKIDVLMSDVEKTDLRVKDQNKRIKKSM